MNNILKKGGTVSSLTSMQKSPKIANGNDYYKLCF